MWKKITTFALNKKMIKISGLFLILLFVFNYASSNFFFHSHIVDDVKVSHSHPYQSAPNGAEGHQHSNASLNFFSSALRTLYTIVSFISTPLLILTLIGSFLYEVDTLCNKGITRDEKSRAPPIF